MAAAATLLIDIKAQTAKLQQDMRGVSNSIKSVESVSKGAMRAIQSLGVGLGVTLGLREILEKTKAQDEAVAQLNASIASTRGIAGQTSAELQQMAADFQRVTTYGDEAILQMQSVLLTFTQIRGDEFKGATEAVLNLSTKLKTDLKSAATQVGKALNDPIAGLSSLTRSGIQFTESQKSTIRSMVELGDVVGAQRIILKELETQFGGSAKAARDMLGGEITALLNNVGDQFELAAGTSAPLRDALRGVNDNFEDVAAGAKLAGTALAGAAIPAALTGIATGVRAITVAVMANPIGLLTVAASSAVTTLIVYRKEVSEILGITRDLAKEAKQLASQTDSLIGEYESLSSNARLTFREQERLNNISKELKSTFPGLAIETDNYGNAVKAAADEIKRMREENERLAQQAGLTAASTNVEKIDLAGKAIRDRYKETRMQFDLATESLEKLKRESASGIDARRAISSVINAEDFQKQFKGIADVFSRSIEIGTIRPGEFKNSLQTLRQNLGKQLDGINTEVEKNSAELRGAIDEYNRILNFGLVKKPPAIDTTNIKQDTAVVIESVGEVRSSILAMQAAIAPVGAAVDAVLSSTTSEIKRLAEESKKLEAARFLEDQIQFGKTLTAQLDPVRNYKGALEELNELYKIGAIDATVHARAVMQANEQMRRSLEELMLSTREFSNGAVVGFARYADAASDAARNAEAVVGNSLRSLEDQLTDLAMTGKFEWQSMVNSMLADLARLSIRQNVTAPIASALGLATGGESAKPLFNFGGFRAAGGNVESGKSYVVGERGRELFTPKSSGQIISNDQLQSMHPSNVNPGNTTINMTVYTQDAKSFTNSERQIKRQLAGIVR